MSKMRKGGTQDAGSSSSLPPPPSSIPPNFKPERVESTKHSIISRRSAGTGTGTSGRRISLLSNHFKVSVRRPDQNFHQYTVSFTSQDKKIVEGKVIGRKIINKLCQTYPSDIDGRRSAYDGEKSFYTVRQLAQKTMEFTVVLDETFAKRTDDGSPGKIGKRSKRAFQSKSFNVVLTHAAQIPLKSISLALQGKAVDNTYQDALRVLDTVLRQHAVNRGCLLVRQSFFRDDSIRGDSTNFTDIGGGVAGCRGFYSSFRTTQDGLTLNMDVATTMILKPGPVIDFLLANQNAHDPRQINWARAKRMLKKLRVKATHSSMEFKIICLSDEPCNQQSFPMKVKTGDSCNDEGQTTNITVYEYFLKHRQIELTWSAYLPCLDVGRPKRPNYLPLELASLISLQRYTKALSTMQRASLVQSSRQLPLDRKNTVIDALRNFKYDEDPLLAACGVNIDRKMIQVDGRVLDAPNLKVGNGEDCIPCNGRWNFNNKEFFETRHIGHWVIVNFSARCDTSSLSRLLITCGKKKGINIERPHTLIEEDSNCRRDGPVARVEKMFEQMQNKLPKKAPEFILCVLPERKNSDIYGPWKKKCLCDHGFVNQCISPPPKINDQYLTNVLLKINSKLGGINSLLAIEASRRIPLIKDIPTMIVGMDVSHGSPGQSDRPSIAAVVGSLSWPRITNYRAAVRAQSPKVEMIDSLYKPVDGKDHGIMRELFWAFYRSSKNQKPEQVIIFRDGVSESQFNQVLNIELEQIIKAYQHLGSGEGDVLPKFTVIVGQKNHHTKLFQASATGNVPPGTVVDTKIVHPTNYDFYMCAQAGMIGTTRPTHYHVLVDEIGFTPDVLQNLIHSLSYVYQRSSTAISIVAPIRYAHLAAAQVGQFIKFDDFSETSSGVVGNIPVPELPRLKEKVEDSMFFC